MSTQSIATPVPPAHGVTSVELRRTLLDAARGPVEDELRQPIRFKVERLKTTGEAAFLLARMEDTRGQPVGYEGTSLEAAAREGFVSQTYAALLRRNGTRWSVVAKAIGPGDVAWEGWSSTYDVTPSLFLP